MSRFVIEVDECGCGRIVKDGVDLSDQVSGFVVRSSAGSFTTVDLVYSAVEVEAVAATADPVGSEPGSSLPT